MKSFLSVILYFFYLCNWSSSFLSWNTFFFIWFLSNLYPKFTTSSNFINLFNRLMLSLCYDTRWCCEKKNILDSQLLSLCTTFSNKNCILQFVQLGVPSNWSLNWVFQCVSPNLHLAHKTCYHFAVPSMHDFYSKLNILQYNIHSTRIEILSWTDFMSTTLMDIV